MKIDRQIQYWAHMLDESSHTSYYDMYMQENPKDKLPMLINALIGEFAKSLRKDNIDLNECVSNGKLDFAKVDAMQKKLKSTYTWELIPAQTYAAIISRVTALMTRTKGQRIQEVDEIQFDDVSRMVSRRIVEKCLDIVCHNTNVLEANNYIVNSLDSIKQIKNHEQISHGIQNIVNSAFEKHGIPRLPRHDTWKDKDTEDYLAALILYRKWGSYAKGIAEEYVCDSDYGPEPLKKVLSSVEYSADTLDLVVTLNKALDIVHVRSDLAAAFVEGGQRTCSLVSNLPDKFVI